MVSTKWRHRNGYSLPPSNFGSTSTTFQATSHPVYCSQPPWVFLDCRIASPDEGLSLAKLQESLRHRWCRRHGRGCGDPIPTAYYWSAFWSAPGTPPQPTLLWRWQGCAWIRIAQMRLAVPLQLIPYSLTQTADMSLLISSFGPRINYDQHWDQVEILFWAGHRCSSEKVERGTKSEEHPRASEACWRRLLQSRNYSFRPGRRLLLLTNDHTRLSVLCPLSSWNLHILGLWPWPSIWMRVYQQWDP